MPRRPPKKWWDRCVKKLKGKVKDPRKVCGWIWYHHAKPETKAEILKEERWIKAALKAIKSPKTPAHLKRALKKKLKEVLGK